MKNITKKILTIFLTIFLIAPAFAQDNRTLETKVADALAQFPAQNSDHTNKLMVQIIETGAPGIARFCDMIVPPGTGNDTQARMALESLAQYAGAPNRENDRKLVEGVLLSATDKATDKEVKAFLIRRLQYCGGTESVARMEKYLNSADLYAPALAVLTSIGKAESGALILKNLPDKKDLQLQAMIKTLGQLKYQPSEPYLIELAKTSKGSLLKQTLAALANIGGMASVATFESAAKAVKFQSDEAETMVSYLQYAKHLAEQGETNLSNQLCNIILKNCTQENQLIYRSSVLSVPGFGTNALFLKEIKNKNKVYRNSVLENASAGLNSGNVNSWIAAMKGAPAETQAEIIHFLANRPEGEVLQKAILPKLASGDEMVRDEAIRSLAVNQKTKAVPVLLEQLKKSKSAEERTEIEKALLITCSVKECSLLAAQLDGMNDDGKIVLINVLGARRATETYSQMISFCKSENSAIRLAASAALVHVSGPENAPEIIAMLKENVVSEIADNLQKALIAIYSGSNNPDANLIIREIQSDKSKTNNTNEVVQTYPKGNGGLTEKLIPVLSTLDDPKAMKTVVDLLKNGNPAEREAAFVALSNWKDVSAAPDLYTVFTDPEMKSYRMNALKAYLRITQDSNLPDDQKLLMIEKLMPASTTSEEKTRVIEAAGNVKTFLSLVFVSAYLDDQELGATAASTAKYLALSSSGKKNGLTGEFVSGVLTKVMGKMTGPDSQYDVIDVREYLEKMPKEKGFVSIFNGKDLSGWHGLVKNPVVRAKMSKEELAKAQAEADVKMLNNWSVKDGCIVFNGEGDNLCTQKMYGDFEMLVDWKISKNGDSGIYLRGSPQVQIWDTSRVDVGAQVGSGGLYNNQKNQSKPLVLADNAIGDWNTFRIKMVGERVTVYLNGILVVDNVLMENYWDRSIPIFAKDAIELQAHGTNLAFRNVFVKELDDDQVQLSAQEEAEGFKLLFNGKNLDNWVGDKIDYVPENGMIVVSPKEGGHGNIYTEKEYSNFIIRFEFQLTPGANNGLGIHAPLEGDAAYVGKELQILDNTADIYKDLQPYQYHGSVYGIIPAKRGFLSPVGEWNYQEVIVKGDDVKITLNGTVILDGNMKEASKNGTADHKDHPGLLRHTGHIGFLGHGSDLKFRNIRIKEL
ncbi:MAG TPA: family 16 glycoside hydrolase [Prolixibacteraceae bacterium]